MMSYMSHHPQYLPVRDNQLKYIDFLLKRDRATLPRTKKPISLRITVIHDYGLHSREEEKVSVPSVMGHVRN